MKYLSLAFVAAVRAEYVEEDADLLLRQLGSHSNASSNSTMDDANDVAGNVTATTTTTTTTTTIAAGAGTSKGSTNTTANTTNAAVASDVPVSVKSAVAMGFAAVPTAPAAITTFKTAVNKEVGKTYCASLSCAAGATCDGANRKMFDTVALCYAAESATGTGMQFFWSAEVEWTGATGFASAAAAATLNPSRRRLSSSGAAYGMKATAMVQADEAAQAGGSLSAMNNAFKTAAEDTTGGGMATAVMNSVNAAMTAAGTNFTMTAPTVAVTVAAPEGVPAATTSGAYSLAASASALLAAVASVALF